MRIAIALFLTSTGLAQVQKQPGLVRGTVINNEAGRFEVLASNEKIYCYRADGLSWIEREDARIRAADLRLGEMLEVVSDRDAQVVRYARLVHVIPEALPRGPAFSAGGVYRLNPPQRNEALTFSGIVAARDGWRLTIHTRLDGDQTIYLTPDTQYIEGGLRGNPAALVPNTRVFIRAERNLDHDIAAFQVIWGATLEPSPVR